jgi:hypothetical protein
MPYFNYLPQGEPSNAATAIQRGLISSLSTIRRFRSGIKRLRTIHDGGRYADSVSADVPQPWYSMGKHNHRMLLGPILAITVCSSPVWAPQVS